MKLAAIWVEEYVKIINQGFNFGGQYCYSFKFNEKDRTLEIRSQETSEFYDLYQGSNILNMSAIIGINGSGKSSILNLLNLIAAEKPLSKNVVIVMEDEDVIVITVYVSTFPLYGKKNTINPIPIGDAFSSGIDFTIKKNKNPFKETDLVFYSNLNSNRNVNYIGLGNLLNRSVDYQLRHSLSPEKVARYLQEYNDKKNNTSLLYLEESFNLKSLYQNDRLERMINFLSDSHQNHFSIIGDIHFPDKLSVWFNENIYSLTKQKVESQPEILKKLDLIFNHCIEILKTQADSKTKFKKTIIFKYFFFALNNDLFKNYTDVLLFAIEDFTMSIRQDESIFSKISQFISEIAINYGVAELIKIDILLKKIEQLLENIEVSEPNDFFSTGYFDLSINGYLWFFLKEILSITDFKGETLINYSIIPMSSGEEAILYQFSEFHEALKHSRKKNIIISIDEGELYLHPEWQRKYINTLYQFFEYNGKKNDLKFQLIVTSHSPFIVCDIPKHNLIFLQKDLLGLCRVSESKNHLPTLGGNIFELFSDGFYVNDFISEFAFEKINQAIKFLNGEESIFKTLVEVDNFNKLIGEAIIRDEIQKMIDLKKVQNLGDYFELINDKDK